MKALTWVFFLGILLLAACGKEEEVAEEYPLVYPSHFPEPVYKFENNPFTMNGFTLGRKLFYDPILSVDSTIACANCHATVHYFADHNLSLSSGVYGRIGVRNSPAIFNTLWNESFMWDGGVNHIEFSGLPAMTDPREMDETIANILVKLRNDSQYPALFKDAFGTEEITDQYLFYALSQFTASIISSTSKYDYYIQGKAEFTELETQGLAVFRANCETCHKEPLLTDYTFRNTGLDSEFSDLGRARITLNPDDIGKFKVPTLRNVLHTYPYMHDGRFRSIDQVLDHYANPVQSPTLDPLLSNGIALTETERTQLKAFLKTLTDEEFLTKKFLYEPR